MEIGVVVVQKNLYREREEGVESSLCEITCKEY